MSMNDKLYNFSEFDLNKDFLHLIIPHIIEVGKLGICCKSKRVSAIITKEEPTISWNNYRSMNYFSNYGCVVATNEPPTGFSCKNNEACKKVCNQVCIHAEENAIIKAFQRGLNVKDGICLHLKIVNNEPTSSGNPSCIYCSRKLLQSGIKFMYLFHEDGWKKYTTEEFHRETLKTLGIEE